MPEGQPGFVVNNFIIMTVDSAVDSITFVGVKNVFERLKLPAFKFVPILVHKRKAYVCIYTIVRYMFKTSGKSLSR